MTRVASGWYPGGTQVVNLIFPWVITGFTQTVRWLQYILHTIMVHRLYGCNQSKVLMTYGYNKFIFHVTRVLHVPVKNNVHHQGGTQVVSKISGVIRDFGSYTREFYSKFFCKFFGHSITSKESSNKILRYNTLSILKSVNDNS